MNEERLKIRIGHKRKRKFGYSYYVKPSCKCSKRLFNKRVRNGARYKRGNWLELW